MDSNFEIDRSLYDNPTETEYNYISEPGISENIIKKISKLKDEPDWMLKKRLESYKIFKELKMPSWGPDISELDLNKIIYYLDPKAKKNSKNWDEVPDEIKNVFEKLGIPEAERKALAGAGAQFESNTIYHNLKKDLEDKGVVFLDMDIAVKKYPELVKKYFMTSCISPRLHKFAALHGAVWSGGTFIYIPKNVIVEQPLQAYFRMNSLNSGQFEHTLIIADEGSYINYIEGCSSPKFDNSSIHAGGVEIHVLKNARVRYNSVENWSKNTYNLNTKRANVQENGVIEWVNGNMGSNVTMLYPCSVLIGDNSKSDFLGIAFASNEQNQDTGHKLYHIGKNTQSTIRSKSISKGGGITTYRGLVDVNKNAKNSKISVECDALMLDNISKSDTIPVMKINNNETEIAHEAKVGKISDEEIFYLMSRGLSEEEALKMVVSGFIEPVVKELPFEYAVELNKLIELEMEGSLG